MLNRKKLHIIVIRNQTYSRLKTSGSQTHEIQDTFLTLGGTWGFCLDLDLNLTFWDLGLGWTWDQALSSKLLFNKYLIRILSFLLQLKLARTEWRLTQSSNSQLDSETEKEKWVKLFTKYSRAHYSQQHQPELSFWLQLHKSNSFHSGLSKLISQLLVKVSAKISFPSSKLQFLTKSSSQLLTPNILLRTAPGVRNLSPSQPIRIQVLSWLHQSEARICIN